MIDSAIQPYDQIIMQLFTDEEIREMLAKDSSSYESVVSLNRFTIKLSSVANQLQYKDIISVSIASFDNKYTYGTESMEFHRSGYRNKFYERMAVKKGKFNILDSDLLDFIDGSEKPAIVYGRVIRDIQLNEIGYIVMLVHQDTLRDALSELDFGGDYAFSLTMGDGKTLYTDGNCQIDALPELLLSSGVHSGTVVSKGKEYAVFSAKSAKYGYSAVNIVPLSVLTQSLWTIRRITVLLAVLFALVALSLAISVSREITRPIDVIVKTVTEISKNNNLTLRIPQVKNIEMKKLITDLNSMLDRIDNLIKENKYVHEEQMKSEMHMLLYQINPHFIYNTLNLIRWLTIINGQPQIKSVVENFSLLIVNTIQNASELVSLQKEILFAESYVQIMRVRYDAFTYEVDIAGELRELLVPRFIFQPFIENAILHGMRGLDRRGVIKLRAEKKEDKLLLKVEDNGVGLDGSEKEKEQKHSELAGFKIGISNVHNRIQLRFGKEYGVIRMPNAEHGVTVLIYLPVVIGG